jgi:type IV secretory pathway TraG/TraD family ATPase VirD4
MANHEPSQRHGEWYEDEAFWFPPGSLPARPRRVVPGVFGNGRLACRQDLAPLLAAPSTAMAGLSLPEVTLLAESSADGGSLEPLLHRHLHLPPELLERHVLVAGTTGAGKTMKVLLPLLAAAVRDPRRMVLAVDAKGGVLFDFVSFLARRYRPGQRVEQVNLKDAERATIHWNPANRLRNRGDALLIAHSVVTNADTGVQSSGGGSNELFWVNSSINLLADVLLALRDDPKEAASLARAREIVDKDAYALAVFADNHPSKGDFNRKYPAIVRVMEGRDHITQQCVVADLAMRLQLLGDENIAANTSSAGGLDLAGLLRDGGLLVLEVPEAHSRQLVPLTNLFVGQLFSALMDEAMRSPGGRLERPCTVLLDEFGSAVGKLADFSSSAAAWPWPTPATPRS